MSQPPSDPWKGDPGLGDTVKAKFHHVTIDTSGINTEEAIQWAKQLQDVYSDMEIDNVSVSGNQISFDAGFSNIDDADADDIKMRIDEYLTMNEAFVTKSINVD